MLSLSGWLSCVAAGLWGKGRIGLRNALKKKRFAEAFEVIAGLCLREMIADPEASTIRTEKSETHAPFTMYSEVLTSWSPASRAGPCAPPRAATTWPRSANQERCEHFKTIYFFTIAP